VRESLTDGTCKCDGRVGNDSIYKNIRLLERCKSVRFRRISTNSLKSASTRQIRVDCGNRSIEMWVRFCRCKRSDCSLPGQDHCDEAKLEWRPSLKSCNTDRKDQLWLQNTKGGGKLVAHFLSWYPSYAYFTRIVEARQV
jgi:hypothetical protein